MSSTELITLLAPLAVALGGVGIALWVRVVTPAQVERITRHLMPGTKLDDLAVQASMMAYKVVEQKLKTYSDWSNEKKLEKAMEYMTALYDYFRHGKLSELAKEALLEYEVYLQHATTPVTPKVAVPPVEAARP
jgi:hypothetical protein